MPRFLLPLPLLLVACGTPNQSPPLQMPTLALQPAPLAAPRGGEEDARFRACRAEATRVVQFRERGQTMRNDESGSTLGGFSDTSALTTYRQRMDQVSAQAERDRMTRECMAAGAPPATPAPPAR